MREKFNPLVSVIIPVYNGEDYINDSIKSALGQTYKNIEVIVIDDGSTDKTKKICESFKNKIKYIFKENGGVSTALNLGIKKSKGEYISWLSHDDLYKPNKIELEIKELSKFMDKNTIVFSNFDLINSEGIVFSKTNHTFFYKKEELTSGIMPVIMGAVNGCTTLINKECFNECGLFDEKLKTVQDYDMWLRLFSKYPSTFIDKHLVQYRVHEKQGTNAYKDRFDVEDNFWLKVIEKITPEYMKSINESIYEVIMILYYKMYTANYKKSAKLCWELGKKYSNENNPIVSILVPCYNEEQFLEDAVESLINQTYGAIEILIIDDYSTDKTYEIAKKLSEKDYRIKVLQNKYEKGLVGNLNTGLETARGKFVTRLDADDYNDANRIEQQLSIMRKKEYGYCATNITTVNENKDIITSNLYKCPIAPIEFECAFGNPIPNATIMYNLELIKDNNLRFKGNDNYAEDYHFLLDYIIVTKSKGIFISDSLYFYRIQNNSAYHKNIENAIKKSINLCKQYIKEISGKEYKNINKYSFSIPPKNLTSDYLKEYIKLVHNFSEDCCKYFDWDEQSKEKIYNYLSNTIWTIHECTKTINYNVNESLTKIIFRKIKWYYEENGLCKLILWLICIPFKKIYNKIKRKIDSKKIKVLEVNNIDLAGKVFNGYDLIKDIDKKKFLISQIVINKQSNNKKVYKILDAKQLNIYEKIIDYEEEQSVHNLFSITTPALFNSYSYYDTELIHFHMFHNTKLSLPSLIKICNEKKVIITLHDPWFLTGRCVHFYDCQKWKDGCKNCKKIDTLFPFKEDNCNIMWDIKKKVFSKLDVDLVVTSQWMLDLIKKSPITKHIKNVHLIPFGINLKKYKNYNNSTKLRRKYNIDEEDFVIFLRAQIDFKGTEYVLEALKKLNIQKRITILTCDQKGLLKEVEDRYSILDYGFTDEEKTIELYNMCDLFLMPSKGESFGMMAIEAMACEKPIIIFDNTALPSITKAPECGYLVKDRDSNELAKAIEYLVNNDEERFRRGKLGRKICKEYYSYDKYINELENLYKAVQKREHVYKENIMKKYSKKNCNLIKQNIKEYVLKNKFEKIDLSMLNNDEYMMLFEINDFIHDLIYENRG